MSRDNISNSLLGFRFSKELEEFRNLVRRELDAKLTDEEKRRGIAGFHNSHDEVSRWTGWLNEKGWAVPGWPAQFGGGWDPLKYFVLQCELALAGAPQNNAQGIALIGPILCMFGSEYLQQKFLPGIASGQHRWAQGFSEPESGSDLASLRTSAVLRGEEWIVNGTKIWTSEAHIADMFYMLVRTDASAKPQRGLSILLVDAHSPGISVRPIIGLDGVHSLNEVTFTDVAVPANHLVGEVNQGWTYAKALLVNERAWTGDIPWLTAQFNRLIDLVRSRKLDASAMRGWASRLAEI